MEKICVLMGQVLLTPPSLKTFHNVHSLLNKTQIAPHGSTIRLTFPSVEPIPPTLFPHIVSVHYEWVCLPKCFCQLLWITVIVLLLTVNNLHVYGDVERSAKWLQLPLGGTALNPLIEQGAFTWVCICSYLSFNATRKSFDVSADWQWVVQSALQSQQTHLKAGTGRNIFTMYTLCSHNVKRWYQWHISVQYDGSFYFLSFNRKWTSVRM